MSEQSAGRGRAGCWRWVLYPVVACMMLVCGLGWALASPVSGAPDDDYHLTSVWCPGQIQDDCETQVVDGLRVAKVPMAIGQGSPCYAFQAAASAECVLSYSDTDTRWSGRYDDGGYPGGFYHFHHILVGPDPQVSAVAMRCANVVIAVALLSMLWIAAPRGLRLPLTLSVTAAWVPMGVYFIASNNPTSWAVTGVFVYAAGMLMASRSEGRRRWVLIGAALLGALLCYSSRYDAAFYLFVVAVAMLFAVRWCRQRWPEALLLVGLGLGGVVWMLRGMGSNRVPGAASTVVADDGSLLRELYQGLMTAPKYLAGFYGAFWHPGWVDTPLDEFAPYALALLAAGGFLALGVSRATWRSWFSASVVVGAMVGLPAAFFAAGVFEIVFSYQARYILPLLAVAFLYVLADWGEAGSRLRLGQAVWLLGCVVIAHASTLHTVMYRYLHGLDGNEYINLNYGVRWWWGTSVRPMTVWTTAVIAFVVAVVLAVWLSQPSAEADHGRGAALAPSTEDGTLLVQDDPGTAPGSRHMSEDTLPADTVEEVLL